jgi:signal peptidase I
MRQLVHDTDHDPAELDSAGWPLRWHSPPGDEGDAWKLEKSVDDNIVRQRYSVKAAGDGEAWLRYEHVPPDYEVWRGLAAGRQIANLDRSQVRRLITDSNPYNARVDERNRQPDSLRIDPSRLGLHWVGDLMLDADVEVEAAEGELLLDLVEGGRHFTCTIDLKSGDATLSAEGAANFTPKAKTPISSAGSYHVALANVDDQLLLWVDDKLIAFDGSTAYDVAEVFGSRDGIRPHTSDDDLGDLAPAGIGARGAKLAVTRLQLWRDIYYIAVKWRPNDPVNPMADFDVDYPNTILDLDRDPSRWDLFGKRRHEDFRLTDDQFFVMGDNSAESSDARLWCGPSDHGGKPGGEYLERRLLIGKALCVYWPHSWNRVPGTPIPFPLFPNFADMRLVR